MKMRFIILFLFIILGIGVTLHSAQAKSTLPTILSVDFGSEFIKIGSAARGKPIDLVLNEQSKRKTSNFIGFRRVNERLFGENARQITARFPSAAVRYYMQMFLGKRYSLSEDFLNERCKNDLGLTGWTWKENAERKTIDLVLRGEDNVEQVFQPEELVAYMLRYITSLVDANSQHVSGLVFTVPPYFSIDQRNAIMSAAKLADVNLIGILSETAALAIHYGATRFSKLKDQIEPNSAHHIIIYDMGATTITASVVRFTHGKSNDKFNLGSFKILSTKWSKNLGGEDYTNRLAQHIVSKFKESHGHDISQNERVMERVRAYAKKAKEVLTANSETIIYIESIYNDIDYSLKVTRSEFEEMCEGLNSQVLGPIREALLEAKLNISSIDALEVVGGGARVIAVQDRLNRFYKKGISHTLNGDESIALGAVLYGASKTPLFRVRSFEFEDFNPFGIEFVLSGTESSPEKTYTLFKVGDVLNLKRFVNIPRHEDFSLTLKYSENTIPQNYREDGLIAKYTFNKVGDAMSKFLDVLEKEEDASAKVRIGYELTKDGIVRIDSAEAVLEQYIVPETTESSENKEEAKEGAKVKKEKKITREKVEFEVEHYTLTPVSEIPEIFGRMKDRMLAFEKLEEEKKIIAHARNELESNYYNTLSALDDEEYIPYFQPFEIEKLRSVLSTVEEWMNKVEYDTSVTAKEYEERSAEISKIILPVKERREEEFKRSEKANACRSTFKKLRAAVAKLGETAPHITEEEKKEFLDSVASTEKWLAETIEKAKSTPLNEPPSVTHTDIELQCSKLNVMFNILSRKPKIEEKAPETSATNDQPNQETQNNQSNDQTNQGNNPQGNNPQGNNPQGNNPQGNNPQGNNPQGNEQSNPNNANTNAQNPQGNGQQEGNRESTNPEKDEL